MRSTQFEPNDLTPEASAQTSHGTREMILCIAIALLLGTIQISISLFSITLDGISYLDMADAYLRHDWHTALNGYWNPLYSWLICIAYLVFKPSGYWEYPAVHLVNLCIYALAILAFEYFLQGLRRFCSDFTTFRVVAYAVFIWTSLGLIRLWMIEPDILLLASLCAAMGVLIRPLGKSTPILLACSLAVGYYAKAVMFPISIMALISASIVYSRRTAFRATLIFGLMTAPLVLALSLVTGHPTFGDTSRLNYAWYVDGVTKPHWDGQPSRAGKPLHPEPIVIDAPRVYGLGGVFPVTCPLWYDPSYWYRGLRLWIGPRALMRNTLTDIKGACKILLFGGGSFLLGWAICAVIQRPISVRLSSPIWVVWFVSLSAILLYVPVHIEPRLIGPFALVLLLVPFTSVHIPGKLTSVAFAGLSLVWALFGPYVLHRPEFSSPWNRTQTNAYWQIAEGLQQMGLKPGDQIGVACSGMGSSRWARLGKFEIVAQMAEDPDPYFWQLNRSDQERVIAALFSSGAKLVITDQPPPNPESAAGWHRVGVTNYYTYSNVSHMESLLR